jgi:hypothetical protein
MGSFEDAKRRAGVLKAQRWLGARSKAEKSAMSIAGCLLVGARQSAQSSPNLLFFRASIIIRQHTG